MTKTADTPDRITSITRNVIPAITKVVRPEEVTYTITLSEKDMYVLFHITLLSHTVPTGLEMGGNISFEWGQAMLRRMQNQLAPLASELKAKLPKGLK